MSSPIAVSTSRPASPQQGIPSAGGARPSLHERHLGSIECKYVLGQIVKMDALDANLVSSGKSEAEAALGRATDEVCSHVGLGFRV